MGGSLCRDLKKKGKCSITAYGRDTDRLAPALDDGVIDRMETMERIDLAGVDLVVVSIPVIASISVLRDIVAREDLEPGALVLDVGSVKGAVCSGVEGLTGAGRFIGCHPMVGSEKMGYSHSRAGLYENAWVIITPGKQNDSSDVDRIEGFWQGLGARTMITDPDHHDLLVAYTSHLPHIISCITVDALMKFQSDMENPNDIVPFIGKGFLDVTRIAAGSPEMWQDIIENNIANISAAVVKALESLKLVTDHLNEKDQGSDRLRAYFSEIKKFRESL